MTTTLADIVAEGERLLDLADDAGLELRLLGGVAVRMRAPVVPAPLDREYKDLDFAVRKKGAGPLDALMRSAGYEPHVTFNAMNARERALYLDEEHGRQVDVFIESFRMCHEIELGDRICLEPRTLPLAELLLTKLQIVELNEKDVDDCLRLLVTFPLASTDAADALDLRVFGSIVGDDWGWWRTVTLNLARIRNVLAEGTRPAIAGGPLDPVEQLDALEAAAEAAPKSRRWKLRARIGEHRRWYEIPEETPHPAT
jgi:hypothetical protein